MWSLLSWGSHPRNAGSPNSSIFHAVWFSLIGLTVHLPRWVCTCVCMCVCVESIFLANRLSNVGFLCQRDWWCCFSLYWQERALLTNDFCFSPNVSGQLLFCVSPRWTGIPPSKRQSKKICRKMFIIQLNLPTTLLVLTVGILDKGRTPSPLLGGLVDRTLLLSHPELGGCTLWN